jgi:hypothetical protein
VIETNLTKPGEAHGFSLSFVYEGVWSIRQINVHHDLAGCGCRKKEKSVEYDLLVCTPPQPLEDCCSIR